MGKNMEKTWKHRGKWEENDKTVDFDWFLWEFDGNSLRIVWEIHQFMENPPEIETWETPVTVKIQVI